MRRKPLGWPDLMTAKRLSTGVTAYYWSPPTRARKGGCPVAPEALSTDYAIAKGRCDDVLNAHYRAWLRGAAADAPGLEIGSFDWMVSIYKKSHRYTERGEETRSSYDRVLRLVSSHVLKDGRSFGKLALTSITPGAADKLYAKLKIGGKAGTRNRTAVLAMRVCQRAWNVALRSEPKLVPSLNPFQKMGLTYKAKPTLIFGRDDLVKFVAKADELDERSIGTAALIAFNWLQREVDIINRLAWSHYRPADAPETVKILHHKTGEVVDLPLYDDDGTDLWPDLTPRLDAAVRYGTLIVTRDNPDRFKAVRLPWKKRHFLRRVAAIRKAAGIDAAKKFMGLRHGGNTEGADADLSDAQMRALSGHKTNAALLRYAQSTVKQRRSGARMRLASRTKKENLSE
jgi:hypothetical protein